MSWKKSLQKTVKGNIQEKLKLNPNDIFQRINVKELLVYMKNTTFGGVPATVVGKQITTRYTFDNVFVNFIVGA